MASIRLSTRAKGLVVLLIGAGLLVASGWLMSRAWRLASEGKETTGRVIERDHEARTIKVRYNDLRAGKHEVTFEVEKAYCDKHPRGARVELIYLADAPEEPVLAHDKGTGSGVIILLVIGLLVAGCGGVVALRVPGKPV